MITPPLVIISFIFLEIQVLTLQGSIKYTWASSSLPSLSMKCCTVATLMGTFMPDK